jgi:alpha-1,6-mannosyltransferase
MVVKHIAGNPHVRLFTPERNGDMFARILASADALIHGSEAETFCMAAAEARASGIPVIVPNEGGAADHASGGAGTTYAARDPAAASRAILSVLAGPEHQPCYARTSTEHFAELFALYERTHTARQRAA